MRGTARSVMYFYMLSMPGGRLPHKTPLSLSARHVCTLGRRSSPQAHLSPARRLPQRPPAAGLLPAARARAARRQQSGPRLTGGHGTAPWPLCSPAGPETEIINTSGGSRRCTHQEAGGPPPVRVAGRAARPPCGDQASRSNHSTTQFDRQSAQPSPHRKGVKVGGELVVFCWPVGSTHLQQAGKRNRREGGKEGGREGTGRERRRGRRLGVEGEGMSRGLVRGNSGQGLRAWRVEGAQRAPAGKMLQASSGTEPGLLRPALEKE